MTLRELLQHRSGLPDYTSSPALARRLQRAPRATIAPATLLRFVWDQPLQFRPGRRYRYDNSDNIVVAMMARAAAGRGYQALLRALVYRPAAAGDQPAVRLPAAAALPARVRAHGGPASAGRQRGRHGLRGVGGRRHGVDARGHEPVHPGLPGAAVLLARRAGRPAAVRAGRLAAAGAGANAAGLAVFRYRTRCGTVYGHTGNFPGYTQFAAARLGGADSAVVTATEQVGPRGQPRVLAALRQAELLAVCAALGRRGGR